MMKTKRLGCLVMTLVLIQAITPATAAMTLIMKKDQGDQQAWQNLANGLCSGTIGTACAAAAVQLASQQCSASASLFQRQKVGYSRFSLFLILLSAGFTGVGASATIANAKIYSTLGGTTGIGAATTAVNSDATADQTSLSAISTAIGKLEALGSNYASGDAEKVYLQAPAIAAECNAAAGTSPAASKTAS
jgi:hypothetical protein